VAKLRKANRVNLDHCPLHVFDRENNGFEGCRISLVLTLFVGASRRSSKLSLLTLTARFIRV